MASLGVGFAAEREREYESLVQNLTLNEFVCSTHLFHNKKSCILQLPMEDCGDK